MHFISSIQPIKQYFFWRLDKVKSEISP